jgi:hypothetical protein
MDTWIIGKWKVESGKLEKKIALDLTGRDLASQ